MIVMDVPTEQMGSREKAGLLRGFNKVMFVLISSTVVCGPCANGFGSKVDSEWCTALSRLLDEAAVASSILRRGWEADLFTRHYTRSDEEAKVHLEGLLASNPQPTLE